jgi:UPF0755 protein
MKRNTRIIRIMEYIIAAIAVAIIYAYIFVPTTNFPVNEVFEVKSGSNILQISQDLKDDGYLKSPLLMRAWMSLINKDTKIAAGLYLFDRPANLADIVKKFSSGKFDVPAISITIPEGFTAEDIAERVVGRMPSIDREDFIAEAKRNEGYLFPDTYFFQQESDITDVIAAMRKEFNKRIGYIEPELLSLASIVQGEANNVDDMKIVAGILLERISIDMPLQVDVDKTTYEIYGAPNVPINNPGLDAINAVRQPTKTSYLYYITGNDGNMYYAKTYKEHLRNIEKHLK